MIFKFKSKKPATRPGATVVDGKLILSLPGALSPVVWQMDLAQAKASALEVLHDEQTGQYGLHLKTAKGEKIEVAAFAGRAEAVEGLMAAADALASAHGQIRAAPDSGDIAATKPYQPVRPRPKNARGKWIAAALALVILFVLFTVWSSVMPHRVNTGPVADAGAAAGAQNSSGVPIAADDFLNGH